MSLTEYRKKRNFKKTSEPQGGRSHKKKPIFVIQEHWASHHHFDFRLEAFGTLKSWAVPKGPSTRVGEKRLAVEVEDHPIDYAKFKGDIPKGEYGAGHVEIWDKGTWTPPANLKEQLKKGNLEFDLDGNRLHGKWLLRRTQTNGNKNLWLLIKRHDEKIEPARKKSANTADIRPISPQLATLSKKIPVGPDWIHEIKFDGYRVLVYIKNSEIRFITRNGLDWTEKFADLKEDFQKIPVKEAVLDGEMVVFDKKKRSSFSALQEALSLGKIKKIKFVAFDILSYDNHDLRAGTLAERKLILKNILSRKPLKSIQLSRHFLDGEKLFQKMCSKQFEGIISKNRTLPYRNGRTEEWLKIKCSLRQELVIGGYTDPQGSRAHFGALLMGTYENKKFRYVGKIGTGFNTNKLKQIIARLKPLETNQSPFQIASPKAKGIHWVKPKLTAEVEFRDVTKDGMVRQGSFQGLREDKKSTDVIFERPISDLKKPEFKITHPDRVLYKKDKITKLDVANYYKSVSTWLLPLVVNRPLSFVRCPKESGKTCFYQKHLDTTQLNQLLESEIRNQKVNYIENEEGLLQLAQWGVLELHCWQTHIEHKDHPDQIVFDFDPDESVPWKQVINGVVRLKEVLDHLKLKSFLKATGGKGLHVHVPIAPIYTWEETKEFSKTITQLLENESPNLYTTNTLKKVRKGKIFLDYLRNGYGATAIAPYSLRAKEAPVVALPLFWDDLKKIKSSSQFLMMDVLKIISKRKEDPWKDFLKTKQKIKVLSQQK